MAEYMRDRYVDTDDDFGDLNLNQIEYPHHENINDMDLDSAPVRENRDTVPRIVQKSERKDIFKFMEQNDAKRMENEYGYRSQNPSGSKFVILEEDVCHPASIRGYKDKLLTEEDINHIFIGELRDQLREYHKMGCFALLQTNTNQCVDGPCKWKGKNKEGETCNLRHDNGPEIAYVWINPGVETMFHELDLKFVLQVTFPDASLREIPLSWRKITSTNQRTEFVLEFTTKSNMDIIAVTNKKKDQISTELRMIRNGNLESMILSHVRIPVGNYADQIPIDYDLIRKNIYDCDRNVIGMKTGTGDDQESSPISLPPIESVEDIPNVTESSRNLAFGTAHDPASFAKSQIWKSIPHEEEEIGDTAMVSFDVAICFDESVREIQEEELTEVRNLLRRRSRTVAQLSATRLSQRAHLIPRDRQTEYEHDLFVIYTHRKLHDPHAFRNITIPPNYIYLFNKSSYYQEILEDKKVRKKTEEIAYLHENLHILQDRDLIYRNVIVSNIRLDCYFSIIMKRIQLILDTETIKNIFDVNQRACILQRNNRLPLHPNPRQNAPTMERIPLDSGPMDKPARRAGCGLRCLLTPFSR
jgi:hypothetical protein